MLESSFQARFIKRLRREFPGCVILKNDSGYLQGFPDLTILFRIYWAVVEVKAKPPTGPESFEPNQEYYIEELNKLSYATCVFPENEEEVIYELQLTFFPERQTRLSKS